MLLTILSGIFSLLVAFTGYLYNSWRNTIKMNRIIYLRYIWTLEMNLLLLKQIKNRNLSSIHGTQQIKLLEPYTLNYIPVWDNFLCNQLLQYNKLLIVPLAKKSFRNTELDMLILITKSNLQNISGCLSLIDEVIGKLSITSFLCYLSVPFVIEKIVNKYLPQTRNQINQKGK